MCTRACPVGGLLKIFSTLPVVAVSIRGVNKKKLSLEAVLNILKMFTLSHTTAVLRTVQLQPCESGKCRTAIGGVGLPSCYAVGTLFPNLLQDR